MTEAERDPMTIVKELQQKAALARKRGDVHRKAGREEEARKAFSDGCKLLDEAVGVLVDPAINHLADYQDPTTLPGDQLAVAEELVETLGARGGLLRRMPDAAGALESYRSGAEIERRFVRHSTYNRTNEVKYGLLIGRSTLAGSHEVLRQLAACLTTQLENPAESDKGWTWADLGDCRALLGDVEGAVRAYRTFVEKAGLKSVSTALDVMQTLVVAMDEANDPGVVHVKEVLRSVHSNLE